MKLRVMRTAMRETKKNQSTVKPQEKNKNSDKIETLQNKTKDITEEEAKGKTDSQDSFS